MTLQYITHELDLSQENDRQFAQLSVQMSFLVPASYISTDLVTGFPSLSAEHRQAINRGLFKLYRQHQWQALGRPGKPEQGAYLSYHRINTVRQDLGDHINAKLHGAIKVDDLIADIKELLIKYCQQEGQMELYQLMVDVKMDVDLG